VYRDAVNANAALLFTYAPRTIPAAGDPVPCPTRGVPGIVTVLGIAAGFGLGYILSGADSDKRAREAYAQGIARAPRPRIA
jgi:hypothetical protein